MKYNLRDLLARSTDQVFDEGELHKILSAIPPMTPSGPWIGGGAIRRTLQGGQLDSDFDFFFRDVEQVKNFSSELELLGLAKQRETEHHIHYRGAVGESKLPRDIQLIRFRYYQTAAEVIDSFDYTICQFAFDGQNLEVGEHSLWDLGRKRLAIHKITYPVATMRRMLKYTRQGFTACNGCLTTILRETSQSPELMKHLGVLYVD